MEMWLLCKVRTADIHVHIYQPKFLKTYFPEINLWHQPCQKNVDASPIRHIYENTKNFEIFNFSSLIWKQVNHGHFCFHCDQMAQQTEFCQFARFEIILYKKILHFQKLKLKMSRNDKRKGESNIEKAQYHKKVKMSKRKIKTKKNTKNRT